MKNVMVLVLWVLLPMLAVGQGHDAPFKKCDLIVVSSELPPSELFTSLLKRLALDGYVVERSDKEILTAETKYRTFGAFDVRYFFFVVDVDGKGVLRVRGEKHFDPLGTSAIVYGGMKGSPMMKSWDIMDGFVAGLGFGVVGYLKG